MTFWMVFWKYFFLLVLIGFACMAVWVTIGGYRDIKSLFASLDEEHDDGTDKPGGA